MAKLIIKEIIEEKGLTSAKVADKMGITPAAFSLAISRNPSVKTLEKIANALGVEVSELFRPKDDFIALVRNQGETLTFQKRGELKDYVENWNTEG